MAKKAAKGMRRAKMYEKTAEGLKRKSKFCPKCGPGIFLAQHKDRTSCGKCGYTEFKKKEPQEKK
ncbi:30S ribosomal protein S27ae [Candidatus Woesearchaeota archaeon]|nr:30S ribosomal protein S27ae [Candidatus Woesearchaeota archaeon]MBW3017524.1 30S ribosomal protein S27ae [Candidatus Woesearchaeota archaeon]